MRDYEGVDISNARCVYCGRRVEARAAFVEEYRDGKDKLYNRIYTYWSCPDHGTVPAYVDGRYVEKPSELFKKIILTK